MLNCITFLVLFAMCYSCVYIDQLSLLSSSLNMHWNYTGIKVTMQNPVKNGYWSEVSQVRTLKGDSGVNIAWRVNYFKRTVLQYLAALKVVAFITEPKLVS